MASFTFQVTVAEIARRLGEIDYIMRLLISVPQHGAEIDTHFLPESQNGTKPAGRCSRQTLRLG